MPLSAPRVAPYLQERGQAPLRFRLLGTQAMPEALVLPWVLALHRSQKCR
jgi:hypothetical protein